MYIYRCRICKYPIRFSLRRFVVLQVSRMQITSLFHYGNLLLQEVHVMILRGNRELWQVTETRTQRQYYARCIFPNDDSEVSTAIVG